MKLQNIRNKRWIIVTICMTIFLIFAISIIKEESILIDQIGYNIISKYLISDFMTPIVKIVTQLASPIFLIILTILLIVVIKNNNIRKYICANLIISTVLSFGIKNILRRPRPDEFRIIEENGYSFPSGHSMVSMAFYGLLIYLIYKRVKNKYLKYGLITLLSIVIILIGLSRIYLGVHYTSDVLAGFLLGISYLIIFISIINEKI